MQAVIDREGGQNAATSTNRIINRQTIQIHQLILTASPRKPSVFGPSSQAPTLYMQIPYCHMIDGVFEFGRWCKMGIMWKQLK